MNRSTDTHTETPWDRVITEIQARAEKADARVAELEARLAAGNRTELDPYRNYSAGNGNGGLVQQDTRNKQ